MKSEIHFDHQLPADDYIMLRASAGWNALTPEQAERGIAHTTRIIRALCNGKTVGMARVLFDYGYSAFVSDVIVLPEFQHQGIGSAMLTDLMTWVESQMKSGDYLQYSLLAASGKEPFYEKFGFEQRPFETLGSGMSKRVIIP